MTVTTTYSLSGTGGIVSASVDAGTQRGSAVVPTGSGNAAIFYYDTAAGEIAARTVSAANVVGARVIASSGSVFLGTAGDGLGEPVSAATLSNGNIVLTWASNEPTKSIYFRIFDANLNPLTPATLAEATALNSTRPDVAALTGGGFVITWEKEFNATDHDVVYCRYSANGTNLDTTTGVALDETGALDEAPSVAGLADGGFAIAFDRRDTTNGNTAMWTAVRNADGTLRAAATQLDGFLSINRDVDVVARTDGGFSVLYQDDGWTASATNTQITAANFSASGVFGVYTQATTDAADKNEGSVAGASSSEGFVAFLYNYPFDATDMDLKGGLLDAGGSILTDPASASSIAGGVANEQVASVTWLDGGTVRYTYDYGAGSGSDPDAGVRTGLAVVIRTSTGDTGNNVIDWSASLARNVMNGGDGDDTLTGGAKNDELYGDNNNDTLVGNAGNDYLSGGAGQNTLRGGTGDDFYLVNQQGDIIFENVGEGSDQVESSVSYYLYANVENLYLDGSANLFGVGNDLNNQIFGNGGENLLIGGAGSDTIYGNDARDSLFGQDGDDALNGDAGIDYIVAGNGDDTVDGGDNPDEIYGEAGNDSLNGGAGFFTDIVVGGDGNDFIYGNSGSGDYDLLYGNAGNDTFYVDTPDDLVFEQVGEGTADTVIAEITGAGYYLYANIENLTLVGSTPFGVGNGLDNTLTGNANAQWLLGGAGGDTLNGLAGNDVLFGESGADTFVFAAGSGADIVGDFVHGTDKIKLVGLYTTFAQVQNAFHQNGSDGAIDLGGGNLIILQGVQLNTLTAGDFIFSASAEAPKAAAIQVANHAAGPMADFDFAAELAQHTGQWLA